MTYTQARRKALVVYRKALHKAEGGDWKGANALTVLFAGNCAFCDASRHEACLGCPVIALCQQRKAQCNAGAVLNGHRTKANGLRHFRLTIKQLEALEV